MKIKPPFRVSKKQSQAILDSKGHELVVFQKGREFYAELFCKLLNQYFEKLASVGDTIQWTFPNDSPNYAGETYQAKVSMVDLEEEVYGVYAKYGQDLIPFDDAIILPTDNKVVNKSISLLRQYSMGQGVLPRSTSDLSPLEEWLLIKLAKQEEL